MRARVSFEIDVEEADDCASLAWELENGYPEALGQYSANIENVEVEVIHDGE